MISLSKVDLPAPLRPRKPPTSLRWTSKRLKQPQTQLAVDDAGGATAPLTAVNERPPLRCFTLGPFDLQDRANGAGLFLNQQHLAHGQRAEENDVVLIAPVVAHGDLQLLALDVGLDRDATSLVGVLDGIADQVDEGLQQQAERAEIEGEAPVEAADEGVAAE